MQITRINTYKNPDRVKRKVLLDTDMPKNRDKNIFDRIEQAGEVIERGVDNFLGRFIDLTTREEKKNDYQRNNVNIGKRTY